MRLRTRPPLLTYLLRLGRQCRRFGFIVRRLRCPPGVAFRHGRRCVPGAGWGPGRGLGDREMTALLAAPSAQLVGRAAAGAPVRRASWPVGPPRRTLPEPGGLGPRWGRGCGGARCQRAGRRWCRSG